MSPFDPFCPSRPLLPYNQTLTANPIYMLYLIRDYPFPPHSKFYMLNTRMKEYIWDPFHAGFSNRIYHIQSKYS